MKNYIANAKTEGKSRGYIWFSIKFLPVMLVIEREIRREGGKERERKEAERGQNVWKTRKL